VAAPKDVSVPSRNTSPALTVLLALIGAHIAFSCVLGFLACAHACSFALLVFCFMPCTCELLSAMNSAHRFGDYGCAVVSLPDWSTHSASCAALPSDGMRANGPAPGSDLDPCLPSMLSSGPGPGILPHRQESGPYVHLHLVELDGWQDTWQTTLVQP
jgi:hypothetical protein